MEEKAPRPIIIVQLGDKRVVTHAFIDSGANCNTISYKFFQQLGGHKLHNSRVLIRSFMGQNIQVQGSCELPLFVDEIMYKDMFMVT